MTSLKLWERVALNISHTTDEVFGVNRELPLNYVERQDVDDRFIESLSRNQHIVIYGSSKQGKTSLRKKCLLDTDYIVISCQNTWDLPNLHAAVLKEAGFEVKQSTEKTVSGQSKVVVGADAKVKIPLLGAGGLSGLKESANEDAVKETFFSLEIDPNDPNDVIRALAETKFSKYVVLEDFHYLPDDVQRNFSFSLKAFHEKSNISFIIVGVWREENRLIGYNGDLTDRVLSVDVDTWTPASLREVIAAGGNLLNVQFDEAFIKEVLQTCFDSVHIVQETCRRACRAVGITATKSELTEVGSDVNVPGIIADVVSEQAARYQGFLMRFADGFQETDLQMPRWVIYAILCSTVDELEKGVRLRTISRLIKSKHPKGEELNNGNITQILNSAASLQNRKGTRPLVVDYDASNTSLHVVDKGFLIWLASQNITELAEDLNLPPPEPIALMN